MCIRNLCILFFSGLLFFACKQNGSENLQTDGSKTNTDQETTEEDYLSEYEREDRVIWQKPDLVMNILGDVSDKVIADLGAGTGYFAFRLLHSAKKVLALDIDPNAIAYIDSLQAELPLEDAARIESRLVSEQDPRIIEDEVDIIILVNTYTYINDRVNYFKNVKSKLREGGQVLIIDFKRKELPIGPPPAYKLDQSVVEAELKEAGFEILLSDERSLDYQYIIKAGVGTPFRN